MAIRAGDLRDRVTLQRATEAQDAYGQEVKTWPGTTVATVWAQKLDLSGSELFQAQQVDARISTQFRIRYRTDIAAEMRLVHGSNVYNITSPPQDPDGRRVELILMCSRSAN